MVVKGALSYIDVRTYNGIVYETFREACQARGLIGDDSEWASLFDEAIQWATAFQLRSIFMTVLIYCDVGNVRALFDAYWIYMADDIKYRMRKNIGNPTYAVPDNVLLSGLLTELSSMFSNNGLSIASYDMPPSSELSHEQGSNRLILEELSYDRIALAAEAISMSSALNSDQQAVYAVVIRSVCQRQPFVYFVAGHGGTGKTFLWRTILAELRSKDYIVLAVASSGVATLLMPRGRTTHSRFKIPLDILDRSLCNIGRGTILAALIQKTSLIIWDEAPMTHRFCFEALDRTLRDLLSVDDPSNAAKPFGGLPILLGGDFRQVLLVIQGADRSQIVNASLIRSPLWKHVHVLKLTINMRLSSPALSPTEKARMSDFAQWVLDVGEGRVPTHRKDGETEDTWIHIPDDVVILPEGDKIAAIVDTVYNEFDNFFSSVPYLAQRCIVCPVNTVVDELNEIMVDRVPGASKEYRSFEQIANSMEMPSDYELLYPPELLNSIVLNNYPQHCLLLKVSVPVVLLRNIDQAQGLCNGTRLLIRRLGDHILEAEIMTGTHIGALVGIPRIVLNGTSPRWPFTLQRRQFPIRVCYAMTINKC